MNATKHELAAMEAAYDALASASPDKHTAARMIQWVRDRLRQDRLAEEAAQGTAAGFTASEWVDHDGTVWRTISEALDNDADEAGAVVALRGIATVQMRYAVRVLIGDAEGNVDGDEWRQFDTRAEADACAASMREPPPAAFDPAEIPF
ncbi:MAG: hypothetical protein ACEQSH_00335 [Bacteroidia bacterium]